MDPRRRRPVPPREGGPDIDTPGGLGGAPQIPLPGPGSPAPKEDPLAPGIDESRNGEGPRERPKPMPAGGPFGPPPATPTPTPPAPREPVPTGGIMPPAPGGPGDPPPLGPFEPLPGTPIGEIINPVGGSQPLRRQFGGSRGLTGGGFGLSDPTSDQASDPIKLIQSLLQKRGGLGSF